jgi:exoribonuclease-2
MILANSTWGLWLADGARHLPQPGQHMPGVKVHGHQGPAPCRSGVPACLSTSPLRRYTDPHQWQIISVKTADSCALSRLKPKDAELFSIISSFDAAYSAWFQSGIERY